MLASVGMTTISGAFDIEVAQDCRYISDIGAAKSALWCWIAGEQDDVQRTVIAAQFTLPLRKRVDVGQSDSACRGGVT